MKRRNFVAVLLAATAALFAAAGSPALAARQVSRAGTITSVDASTGTFQFHVPHFPDVTVRTSAHTDFRNNDGTAGTFADLEAGESATVTGVLNADNSLTATRVVVVVVRHVSIDGIVASVEGTGFVVQRKNHLLVNVTTDANTDFRKNDGTPAALADVQPGVEVTVAGVQSADNTLAAKRVLLIVVRPVDVEGTVTSVSAGSFVVQRKGGLSIAVNTDANTDFRKNDGTAAAFADIVAGRAVEVLGIQSADGSVQARRVIVVVVQYVGVQGIITSVDTAHSSIVVRRINGLSTTVTTDASTVFRKNDGTTASFADLQVGETVSARGVQTGDNSVFANRVVLIVARHVQADGQVTAIDPATTSFTIQDDSGASLTVTASIATKFKNNDGTRASFASLKVGQDVTVSGAPNTDGSLAADLVVIVVRRTTEVNGAVVSVNAAGSSFELNPNHGPNLAVLTDLNTDFRKNDGTAATFADVQAGGAVQVTGTQNPDGSIQATRVLLLVRQTVDFQGVVVSVNPAAHSVVVQRPGRLRVTVTTDADTDFRKNDGTTAAFPDLVPGLAVDVHGVAASPTAVSADRVLLLVAHHVSLSGVVASVSPTGFVLHPRRGPDVEVVLSPDTDIQHQNHTVATAADIKAGGSVSVTGTQNADGTVAAATVVLLNHR